MVVTSHGNGAAVNEVLQQPTHAANGHQRKGLHRRIVLRNQCCIALGATIVFEEYNQK